MTAVEPASAAAGASGLLIDVRGLTVDFPVGGETVRAVADLSFRLAAGQALGIVGESGSGKSTVAAALLGPHRGTGARLSGTVTVGGIDVGTASVRELRRLRGSTAAMVFQDPLSSLDPYLAVGDQIAEVYRTHAPRVSRRAARERAVTVLDRVGIPDAVRRSRSRPHEFSGGMRQRALIGMALACEPRVLVADEPTTALDVTVQAQILDLLHELRTDTGMGLVLVSHDLGVVAGSVNDMLVMKGGRAVEHGPVGTVLREPRDCSRRCRFSTPRRPHHAARRADTGRRCGRLSPARPAGPRGLRRGPPALPGPRGANGASGPLAPRGPGRHRPGPSPARPAVRRCAGIRRRPRRTPR
ncbi:ATP-binding cassette domain-containing protein [Streptomyces hygroscopicus subsp. hygroscopicus]|nr:ATP-binding cassette domain-containing protein [Streptomyces hygroscopicus subsp. hygroscopicus]